MDSTPKPTPKPKKLFKCYYCKELIPADQLLLVYDAVIPRVNYKHHAICGYPIIFARKLNAILNTKSIPVKSYASFMSLIKKHEIKIIDYVIDNSAIDIQNAFKSSGNITKCWTKVYFVIHDKVVNFTKLNTDSDNIVIHRIDINNDINDINDSNENDSDDSDSKITLFNLKSSGIYKPMDFDMSKV